MFGELKYIIDEAGNFMIFSPAIHHKSANRSSQAHTYSKCVGAGFISLQGGQVSCWGYSESLMIRSNGRADAEIIAEALGLKISE